MTIQINPAAIMAPRHSMAGHVNPKEVSPSVPLWGHYTIQFRDSFIGPLRLERSQNGSAWTTVEMLNTETSLIHKRYEGREDYSFRLHGEHLRSPALYKIFDHAEP